MNRSHDGKTHEELCAEADRLRSELAAQRKRAALFDTFFDVVPIGLAVVADREGRDIRANPAFARMLDLPSGANASKSAPEGERPTHFRVMKDGEEIPPEQLPLQRAAATGEAIDGHECHVVFADGRVVDLWGRTVPLMDEAGAPAGAVGAFMDVSALRRAEAALSQAKDEAEAANRAKDQFLAMLSHELRTPLTPVVATLDAWEAGTQLPEALREDVRMIRRNIELEGRLIDDLLDLQRVAHGKLSLKVEVVDAHGVVDEMLAAYRGELEAKGVGLVVSLGAARHHVEADGARLQQVLWNVLKNAAKFTPGGGTVRVRTYDGEGGEFCVDVEDTGIGMSAETLRRLFDPFEQADDLAVKRAGGLGLGLAIARRLVDLQKGEIRASSAGPGCGSRFTIWFPSVDAPIARGAPPPASTDGDGDGDGEGNGNGNGEGHLPLRVLLVEDHADTARAMSHLLRTMGHRVDVSDTVAGAVASVEGNDYDVLLTDIGLPDGTGLDLIARIRARADVPVVALTGHGMEADVERCRAAGFRAHLIKPVNVRRLNVVMRQLAARTRGPDHPGSQL